MSAMPSAVTMPTEPDPALYVPIKEAAQLLDKNRSHLARLCQQGEVSAVRHNGRWFIPRAIDLRLSRIRARGTRDLQDLATAETMGRHPREIERLRAYRELFRLFADEVGAEAGGNGEWAEFRNKHVAKGTFRELHLKPDRPETLRKKHLRYRRFGLLSLLRKEYPARDGAGIGEAALAFLVTVLNAGNALTISRAAELTKNEAAKHPGDPAWRLPRYRTVCAEIQKRRPAVQRTIADKGDRAAQANHVPKLKRDYERIAAGDEYCGDERTVVVWVRVLTSRGWRAVRPKLTAWQDMRSRMIVGWILAPHADSRTILGALKRAIRDHGKPRILRTDWGEDYRAAARHGEYRNFDGNRIGNILDELGITVKRVLPYAPWSKPIESFFRAHKNDLDRIFAGFTGGCPAERHEQRMAWIKRNLEKRPTLDDLASALASFFDAHHHREHSAADLFGKTPIEAMAAFRDGPVRRESDDVLDMLFRSYTGPKLVRRDGVVHKGRWYGTGDSRLVPMQGRRVLLAIQPDDAGRAMLCELDRRPLFEVECIPISGMTEQQVREMHRQRQKLLRPYREQARRGRDWLLSQDPTQLMRAQADQAMRDRPAPEAAPSLTIVRPELAAALEAAGPTPSEAASQPASKARRTGTDDEITLADMIDAPSRAPLGDDFDEDEDLDFFGARELEDMP